MNTQCIEGNLLLLLLVLRHNVVLGINWTRRTEIEIESTDFCDAIYRNRKIGHCQNRANSEHYLLETYPNVLKVSNVNKINKMEEHTLSREWSFVDRSRPGRIPTKLHIRRQCYQQMMRLNENKMQ